MDMKSSVNVYAAPERLKTEAALAAVYQHYGIPTWGFGGCTDAITVDEQAGFEYGLTALWAVLTGVNLAHDTGYLGSGMVGDLRALPLNDEINSYVRHLMRGMLIDPEHAAMHVMQQVGPGGNYLMEDHTLQHFRAEFWETELFNRWNLNAWQGHGGPTIGNKLTKKVHTILAGHKPDPLDKQLYALIESMI
jgi:trimethylamine--corrinoid protein Co-methyltransferase